MSAGRPVPLEAALPIAEVLRDLLSPMCTRIEIAGSIRRRKPMVADIEIVAMPAFDVRPDTDLWATPSQTDLLAEQLSELRALGTLTPRDVEIKRKDGSVEYQTHLGDRYQALVYRELPVDLFIVRDPDSWGTIYAIRTGPGDWNQRIVTDCQRYLRRVEGGKVYRAGAVVPCPEERDFFRGVGQPWVEPEERSRARVDIQAVLA